MDLGLQGRVAFVPGASRGLGRGCAQALIEEGARCFLVARRPGPLEEAARSLRAAGFLAADVADAGQVHAAVARCVEELGALDVLVTNAGDPGTGRFDELPPERWAQTYELTLRSVLELVRAALPHLRRSDQARVVNITSIAAVQPMPGRALSNTYRGAVTALAKTLAGELAPEQITVNNIAPGWTLTDALLDELRAESGGDEQVLREALDREAEKLPMHRLANPVEVGRLCSFLASQHAGYITGQTLVIDGGLTRVLQ
jgi:3-oxoacyl-[acyl-carrier protein] reductase